MTIQKYSEDENLDEAMRKDEPMLAVIAFDGKIAFMGHVDECMEHHILLSKMGLPSSDLCQYFRIVFDHEGADWTFVCPTSYKGVPDKTRRITAFYNDGFQEIAKFLSEICYFCDIKIPKRYRRHFEAIGE